MPENKMVKNYDCRNAMEDLFDNQSYYEEYDLAKDSFESAEILYEKEKYRGAYIQLFIGLQNLGQAVVIYRFKKRTKSKLCQFVYLKEQKLLPEKEIDLLSSLIKKRNDIYYNNPTSNAYIDKKEYDEIYKKVKKLIEILEDLLWNIQTNYSH